METMFFGQLVTKLCKSMFSYVKILILSDSSNREFTWFFRRSGRCSYRFHKIHGKTPVAE